METEEFCNPAAIQFLSGLTSIDESIFGEYEVNVYIDGGFIGTASSKISRSMRLSGTDLVPCYILSQSLNWKLEEVSTEATLELALTSNLKLVSYRSVIKMTARERTVQRRSSIQARGDRFRLEIRGDPTGENSDTDIDMELGIMPGDALYILSLLLDKKGEEGKEYKFGIQLTDSARRRASVVSIKRDQQVPGSSDHATMVASEPVPIGDGGEEGDLDVYYIEDGKVVRVEDGTDVVQILSDGRPPPERLPEVQIGQADSGSTEEQNSTPTVNAEDCFNDASRDFLAGLTEIDESALGEATYRIIYDGKHIGSESDRISKSSRLVDGELAMCYALEIVSETDDGTAKFNNVRNIAVTPGLRLVNYSEQDLHRQAGRVLFHSSSIWLQERGYRLQFRDDLHRQNFVEDIAVAPGSMVMGEYYLLALLLAEKGRPWTEYKFANQSTESSEVFGTMVRLEADIAIPEAEVTGFKIEVLRIRDPREPAEGNNCALQSTFYVSDGKVLRFEHLNSLVLVYDPDVTPPTAGSSGPSDTVPADSAGSSSTSANNNENNATARPAPGVHREPSTGQRRNFDISDHGELDEADLKTFDYPSKTVVYYFLSCTRHDQIGVSDTMDFDGEVDRMFEENAQLSRLPEARQRGMRPQLIAQQRTARRIELNRSLPPRNVRLELQVAELKLSDFRVEETDVENEVIIRLHSNAPSALATYGREFRLVEREGKWLILEIVKD
ncbi:MAG: hypothetical protein NUW37_01770 [Planctomycetes bacterium]|nr:hypothetical protein [Planctomycetota bacterium]